MESGFDMNSEERREAEEEEEIESIEQLLNSELSSVEQFKKELHCNFELVQHLDEDLERIKARLEHIKELLAKRIGLVKGLRAEEGKLEQHRDYCKNLVEHLQAIDSQMRPLINAMYTSLRRLVLNETHALYSKSEDNRREMKRISDEAKKTITELNKVEEEFAQSNDFITRLCNMLGLQDTI